MTIANLIGGDAVHHLPPLKAADYASISIVIALCVWAIVEQVRSRRPSVPPASRLLRTGGSLLVGALGLAYVGRLFSFPPFIGRALFIAALLVLIVGYRQDRHGGP